MTVLNLTAGLRKLDETDCVAAAFNVSAVAEGLVGGHLPNARFVFPLLRSNSSKYPGSRHVMGCGRDFALAQASRFLFR